MPRYRDSTWPCCGRRVDATTPSGVRRRGVTPALHVLEGRGLIKGTRNRITVVDRDGLRGLANGFYGVPEAEYDRTIRLRRAPRRA